MAFSDDLGEQKRKLVVLVATCIGRVHDFRAPDALRMLEQTWVKLVSSAELENAEMKPFLMAFAAALAGSSFAFADTPVTPAEAEKIKAALQGLGCTGGKMEKETEASGYFEVDDAKCRDGQYDIKLDKDFKLIAMTRD